MLNPADAVFAATLPQDCLRPVAPRYLAEPRGGYAGIGGVLAVPRSTAQVAAIVRACAVARVGVVPFGGGTGLVGGQVMAQGPAPLILSLERMATIRALYPAENVMVAEAGAILADVQAAAAGADRLFALSLASEGSARIGGNLATNAGGVNVLRYGNARDLCLGLEAVLADGTIWNGLKRLRKDNTGYDLRNLLIGSEGTLGIITAAALKLHPRPAVQGAALLVVPGPAAALALLALAQALLGDAVSAFELISRMGLAFLAETSPEVRQPFAEPPEWMVLIDLGLPGGAVPETLLEALFVEALDRGLVLDGLVAHSGAQRDAFWKVRETIPLANRRIGAVSSHDISLPLGVIPEFIASAGAALAGLADFRINCFGHLGDGNLHYNLFPARGKTAADYLAVREDARRLVHDMVDGRDGSVAAEHGVGRLKVGDLERYGDPAKLAMMHRIKQALDPLGILNPGAVLRQA